MRNLVLSTLSILAFLIYPLSLSAQNSFSLSLDVDGATGDQAVTSLNTSADQVIAIQIFGKDIQNANGLAVRFEYDASQVVYEGFDAGNVLPNAQALPEQGTGFVEIGIASLGDQATANSGLIGTVRFRATAAFSGTEIRLVRAELSRGGRFETVTIDMRVDLKLQVLTPDFNRDGMVNFADFLAFVGQFGARQGDERYDAKYDLDSDGAIGFGDFLIFSSSFGKEVSTPNGGSGGDGSMVSIPDANLRAVIADSLGKASGALITRAEMANLTVLKVSNKNISDLTGLEFATNLKWVWFSDNQISDVSPLSNLTSLEHLNLSTNLISDISALSNLTDLKWVKLFKNQISDVAALSGLTSLESLDLSTNVISDISPLSNLTNLKWLSLDENQISGMSALTSLTNLTNLQLAKNQISDMSALSNLTSLTYLHLSDNAISDVFALSNLTSLEYLNLHINVISDISPLSNLTNLTNLYLSRNNISDLSPLVVNTGLGSGDEVNVRDNPLSTTSLNTHIPALQARGVDVQFGASKPAVNEIEPGSRLKIMPR